MKSALVIQCLLLPATLADLLTVHLVMPPYHENTVTGKKQSSDETPVEMSQIPGDKVVCLSDDNEWVQYCADRETVNYIDQISFEEKTKDPRPMIIKQTHGTATCNLTVTGKGDIGYVVWDVTNGQRGLRDYKLAEGFQTEAIKIECDQYYVDPSLVEEKGYAYASDSSKLRNSPGKYGRDSLLSASPDSMVGSGSYSGDTVLGSGGGAD